MTITVAIVVVIAAASVSGIDVPPMLQLNNAMRIPIEFYSYRIIWASYMIVSSIVIGQLLRD